MNSAQQPARVRFAPSPTGYLHLGGARTALYDYLLARQTGGSFILRIEDTDQKRYQKDAEQDFQEGLKWLQIPWDEGPGIGGPHQPYRQSLRREHYQTHALQLIQDGCAYYCFCDSERLDRIRREQLKNNQNPRYDGTCRRIRPGEAADRVAAGESHVIRFKSPREGRTTAVDQLRGEITVDNSTLDDIILVKSNGLPVYHLAATVDDHLMGITHVIRGSEWLPTFPIHTLLYDAFGWEEPHWVHLSVLLKPDGKGKMSKRDIKQAEESGLPIFIKDMEKYGYLPEAVANWIALMGWSYDDKTEFFTLGDLVEKFSLDKLNPSPAAINFSKLDHFNGLHIRHLAVEDFARRIKPYFVKAGYQVEEELLLRVAEIIQTRTKKLIDVVEMAGFFFEDDIELALDRIISEKMSAAQAARAAEEVANLFQQTSKISPETAEQPLRDLASDLDLKAGQLFGLLREILTGQKVSPPLFDMIAVLGRETTIQRIKNAQKTLANQVP